MQQLILVNTSDKRKLAWVCEVAVNVDMVEQKKDRILHATVIRTFPVPKADAEKLNVDGTYQFLLDAKEEVKCIRIDAENCHKWVAVNNCKHYTAYLDGRYQPHNRQH